VELGAYTFAEVTSADVTPQQRLRNLLEEIELADQLGLDVFGVGEHHRPDFAVSSPAVVLAAAAERTQEIRLTSAVSVLSSDDPVRVFQDFATLDLLSDGRAEIMAGRGSFIESFALFGYDLDDYDELFAEKLELLLALRESERITWSGGRHRASIDGRGLPAAAAGSVAGLGRRRRLAAIGAPGRCARPADGARDYRRPAGAVVPFAELHRRAGEEAGHGRLPLSISSHGYLAETSQRALDESFPSVSEAMNRIDASGGGRRSSGPTTTPRPPYGALTSSGARSRWSRRSTSSTSSSATTGS
jgi:alkanesulfonate monooxygenase SsuD/methylene tetrahydromethanopterin reductase-like flavin-dependent oxidoreductase (luciferase family)